MEISFKTQLLADLYEGKKVTDKNFKSNPSLVLQYIKTIRKLESLSNIEQAYQYKSLRYEKLIGDLKGKSSVSVNMQFRIIFEEIASENEPCEIILLSIEELSKHYE
ncbi:type II toxin-antitoxin system RelE/ParE family toxin [Pedobacter sp. MC2016-15]|uniref:type II toxin-antitoxin system RelE/ParE family toxin n=1 Tax=Pedobacter sp. MC2016-15 TaxID=2994473 RepID=UPI002246261F|nr:type II toxin-antitoxin system RelE/ParE family toxin [Pedobacter sp. MC2016-15]MCX2478565.1 type II toxin-antitoxin system RelE/ParE family toxin [Pedobacter sp. MC2016-15]